MRILPSLALLALPLLAGAQRPSFVGRVVGVSDGDTIRVLREERGTKKQIRVRLHGVDAPETAQPFGTRSKQFASDMVFGKTVRVEVRDTDRYGRTVGSVTLGGRSLNLESAKAGMAWWYRQYAPTDKALQRAEAEAKAAKRGLWASPNPMPPWEFRRGARSAGASAGKPSAAPRAADGVVLRIGRGQRFHRETCEHAKGAKTTKMTRKEAEGKGLSPCHACRP